MIRSGKELKVFTLQGKDIKKFTQEAKRYGVLYCVLKDKEQGDSMPVDIIVRAEDAAKIQRIVERFELGKVDKATIVTESEVTENPTQALTKEPPSKQNSEQEKTQPEKPSVKDKIKRIKAELGHDTGNMIRTAEELTKKSEAEVPAMAIQTKEPKRFKQEKGR